MKQDGFDRTRVGTYLGLGFGFAATAVFFMVIGYYLDRQVRTTPLFTILGVLIGGAAGLYNLIRQARAAERGGGSENEEREDRNEST